jgi:hypothetical protein
MIAFTILFSAAGFAACGTQSSQTSGRETTGTAVVGTGNGSDVECHDEQVLGSSIPRKVCREKHQNDIDRKGAQDWVVRPQAAPTSGR